MRTKDPVLEEIRETRERLLEESGGTLAGLVERLQAEERASGRTVREGRRINGIALATDALTPEEEHLPSGS